MNRFRLAFALILFVVQPLPAQMSGSRSIETAAQLGLLPPELAAIAGVGAMDRYAPFTLFGPTVRTVGVGGKYRTPAQAMAEAKSGDTVFCFPGTYSVSELVVKSGVNLGGAGRDICHLTNPVDHVATVVALGNNRIFGLDIAAYPGTTITSLPGGYTYGAGESPAIGLSDAATPISIEDCSIGCGTDGIYCFTGHLITGTGIVAVRRCQFTNLTWDICRLETTSGQGPTIITEDNEFIGTAVVNGTNPLVYLMYCDAGAGIWHSYRNKADIALNSTGGYNSGFGCGLMFATAAKNSSVTARVRSANNYCRIVANSSQPIHAFQIEPATNAAQWESRNDHFDISGGGEVYTLYYRGATSNSSNGATNSPYFKAWGSTIDTIGTLATTNKYMPPIYLYDHAKSFQVDALAFSGLNWTNASTTINRSLYNAFLMYTYRAGDKVTVDSSSAGLTPGSGTVTAKGGNTTITVSGLTGSGNVTDNSVTGHFQTRDIHCGYGDVALITVNEALTVHIVDTQLAGQRLKAIFTNATGSNYVVTFGSGITTGTSTMTVNTNTKAIVQWISNGTSFYEVDRDTGL